MARGVLLTRKAVQTLRRDHYSLRHMVRKLGQRVRLRNDSKAAKATRVGITATSDKHRDYPTSGNTFVVRLEHWQYEPKPGSRDVTYKKKSQYIVARTYDGSYISEGTHVVVDRQAGLKDSRWWIRPTTSSSSSSSSSSSTSSISDSSSEQSSATSSSISGSSSSSVSLSSVSSSSVSSSSVSGSSVSSSSSSTSSCAGPCNELEIVTDVQCINGSIVVTKKTLRICGTNVCVEVV